MPLIHSSSPSALKTNMRTLHEDIGKSVHVKSPEQAVAIALNTQREAKKKGHKRGGRTHFQVGGFANPMAAPVIGPPMPGLGMAPPVPAPAPVAAGAGSVTQPTMPTTPAPVNPAPAQPAPILRGSVPTMGIGGLGISSGPSPWAGLGGGFANAGSGSLGGFTAGVGMGAQAGGAIKPPGQMPWFGRMEARGLGHTGPIPSIVPGRTDRHNLSVPSGSYIMPADTISHLGQNNTSAGYAVLGKMFGRGPFGASAPKMGHGMGLPKPPKLQNVMTSSGGARGHDLGQPVPIVAAGGEDALAPHEVAMVGAGQGDIEKGRRIIATRGIHPLDVENGHKILDAFTLKVRKKHVATLKGLPPPAKS